MESLSWLAEMDWIREALGVAAICIGLVSKWLLGNYQKSGWLWGAAASILWMGFAYRVESPVQFLLNIVYIVVSVRGYSLWVKRQEDRQCSEDIAEHG
jgi:hypothetical protein